MIKAEDLRLNNLIEYTPFTGISEITEVNIYNLADICGESEIANHGWKGRYNPIELNEEWLIKLGLEKTISITKEFNLEYIDYRMDRFVCFLLPDNRLEVEFWAKHNTINERGYIATVKYVHQFQNLYFALLGTELTTKP